MKKKRIVENDKSKILQTIKELDQKKNQALNVAWQKVCPTPCSLACMHALLELRRFSPAWYQLVSAPFRYEVLASQCR